MVPKKQKYQFMDLVIKAWEYAASNSDKLILSL
jgi:hypothetical protein